MSFKDQVKNDIAVFLNQDEFAETHTINGKEVVCVLDLLDQKQLELKGTTTINASLIMQVGEITAPKSNDIMTLDGEVYSVSKVTNSLCLMHIDLVKETGMFNKPIDIYNATTIDRGGGWTEMALGTLFHSCNAYIRNQSGYEIFKSNTKLETSQTLFKIPYVEGLEKSMILVYKGKHYDILHIDNIEEQNVFVDLICEKVE